MIGMFAYHVWIMENCLLKLGRLFVYRFPCPRPETTRDILERSFALCPELAPPEIREKREPTLDDVVALVIEDGCGLRPSRRGGIRLEVEWVELEKNNGRRVPVIFNYG